MLTSYNLARAPFTGTWPFLTGSAKMLAAKSIGSLLRYHSTFKFHVVSVTAAEEVRQLLNDCQADKTLAVIRTSPDSIPWLSATQVTALGAITNVLLSVLKIGAGRLTGSAALVADGSHSLSDLLGDGVCMIAVKSPPAVERLCTLVIAMMLTSAGVAMSWSSLMDLLAQQGVPAQTAAMGTLPLLVALFALVAKEMMFRVTRHVALTVRSSALLANAKHHRSDAMSSMAAAVGSVGVILGFPVADTVAAATVGLMMIGMGVEVAFGAEH